MPCTFAVKQRARRAAMKPGSALLGHHLIVSRSDQPKEALTSRNVAVPLQSMSLGDQVSGDVLCTCEGCCHMGVSQKISVGSCDETTDLGAMAIGWVSTYQAVPKAAGARMHAGRLALLPPRDCIIRISAFVN